jgi:hypothetical protein
MRFSSELKKFILLALAGGIPVAVFMVLPYGTFADINAVPAHPLIVHGVVVAVPVVALWFLLSLWKTKVFTASFVPMYVVSVLATLGVIAAKSSGASLTAAVGLPDPHADSGNRLVPVMIAFTASLLVVYFLRAVKPIAIFDRVLSVAAGVVAVALLPLTYVAGHTGAEAVWEEDYAKAQQPISREDLVLTMDEVARRNDETACWTVVNGVVYDMTTFIRRHPAGAKDIKEMCGEDGTEAFSEEHSGQGEPEKWLETLRIGVIGG